jgi:hypothetical protein
MTLGSLCSEKSMVVAVFSATWSVIVHSAFFSVLEIALKNGK